MRAATVLTQKLSRPARGPVPVGLKRTRVVQLSPLASVRVSVQVPPARTEKSAALSDEEAIPNRQKVRLPAPVLVRVTATGALVSPICNDPKSTSGGVSSAVGSGAEAKDVKACAGGAPTVPAQAKAATAERRRHQSAVLVGAEDVVRRRILRPGLRGHPTKGDQARSKRGFFGANRRP